MWAPCPRHPVVCWIARVGPRLASLWIALGITSLCALGRVAWLTGVVLWNGLLL